MPPIVGVAHGAVRRHSVGSDAWLHLRQHVARLSILRMPNIHLEPGGSDAPTREQMIADVKDGVMIDGRGRYSIDQQRYNGEFGGHIFWEIKNGKITRQVTDVT